MRLACLIFITMTVGCTPAPKVDMQGMRLSRNAPGFATPDDIAARIAAVDQITDPRAEMLARIAALQTRAALLRAQPVVDQDLYNRIARGIDSSALQ